MKTAKLNDIFEFEGRMVKVIGIAEGKTIIMKPLPTDTPRHSAVFEDNIPIHVLEHSSQFQQGAKPIPTITEQ